MKLHVNSRCIAAALALSTLLVASVVHATQPLPDETKTNPEAVCRAVPTEASASYTEQTESKLGAPVAGVKLNTERGKGDLGSSVANLGGVVSGNSAINVVTGSNTIDAGSFANMSGLPVVIQNTGANVLIQNATVINVLFK
jgi:hypothetical protein